MQDVTNPQSDYATLARCETMTLTECTINSNSNEEVSIVGAPGVNLSSPSEADLENQLKRNQPPGNTNSCFRPFLDISKRRIHNKAMSAFGQFQS